MSLGYSLAVMVARTLLFQYTGFVVISDVTRLAATHRFTFLWFHAASGVSQSAASRWAVSRWCGAIIQIFGLGAVYSKTQLQFIIPIKLFRLMQTTVKHSYNTLSYVKSDLRYVILLRTDDSNSKVLYLTVYFI